MFCERYVNNLNFKLPLTFCFKWIWFLMFLNDFWLFSLVNKFNVLLSKLTCSKPLSCEFQIDRLYSTVDCKQRTKSTGYEKPSVVRASPTPRNLLKPNTLSIVLHHKFCKDNKRFVKWWSELQWLVLLLSYTKLFFFCDRKKCEFSSKS